MPGPIGLTHPIRDGGRLLARSFPKQPSRYQPQHDEDRSQTKLPHDTGVTGVLSTFKSNAEYERNHGNECLGERRCKERARHPTRPDARDAGTHEPDGEHREMHLSHGTFDDGAHPEEDKGCGHCDAGGDSVCNRIPFSCYQLIDETCAEQESAPNSESARGPLPSHEKIPQQGHDQDGRCHERDTNNAFVLHNGHLSG